MSTGVRIAWRAIPHGMPRRDAAWGLLVSMLPASARLSNPCPRCGGPHGPVRVEGADAVASVSYAGELAVVAVGDSRAIGIGIDAEPESDPRRDAAGLDGVLGPGEASLRAWTRVEAALKADGRGLRVDPATVRVRDTPSGWIADVPDGGAFEGWDAEGPTGVLVSVAVRRVSAGALSFAVRRVSAGAAEASGPATP
ncbi:chemotaxis protein CheY [Microbacterium sp. AZCO]|uniref:4'-phosphopantetheinyl transferase family protein n=1 Tax=Microbacterium sp. AZCO TaxID=3142976 RepID=UPI0031F4783A